MNLFNEKYIFISDYLVFFLLFSASLLYEWHTKWPNDQTTAIMVPRPLIQINQGRQGKILN